MPLVSQDVFKVAQKVRVSELEKRLNDEAKKGWKLLGWVPRRSVGKVEFVHVVWGKQQKVHVEDPVDALIAGHDVFVKDE